MFEITGKVLETSKQSYPSLKPDTMMPSLEPITRTKPKAVVPNESGTAFAKPPIILPKTQPVVQNS